jgi:hypothetical protein
VLPSSVALQRFQLVSWWRSQNGQLCGCTKLEQFPQRDALDGAKTPCYAGNEKSSGVSFDPKL